MVSCFISAMSFSMTKTLTSKQIHSEYCSALRALLDKPTNPKLSLTRMTKLLALIGRASEMKIVQVVGTNGKGSTVAFVDAMLRESGFSCGLFTSPHLCTARERIRINGAVVSEEEFSSAAREVLALTADFTDEPSFFECVLGMAMLLFKKHRVDVAILEAGLGGRLDATTATNPDVLGVTMIDLDHQSILGDTVQAIAHEKIGAAHVGQRVVSVKQHPDAMRVLMERAEELRLRFKVSSSWDKPLGLYGVHQKVNAGLAVALVHALEVNVDEAFIERGLRTVAWPGRFEIFGDVVLDGAHNPSGIAALVESLAQHPSFAGRGLIMVYGSLSGPNAGPKVAMLARVPGIKQIFLHHPNNHRALSVAELRSLVTEYFSRDCLCDYSSWAQVVARAREENAAIVVCGSLYTVGEIRSEILGIPMDEKQPNF